ncbi:MAG: ParA family protein [Methylovulum sp.]|nr:ParA family protein [Methylovulum sp.]
MRKAFGAKLKLAKEFVGFDGEAREFRALFDKIDKTDNYHNLYSPQDLRVAKLKLHGLAPTLGRSRSLPPIINCRMAKGGTGKTTICGGVATALAMFGYKVLMLDGDPQASLTGLFGINWATEDITHIGELMFKHCRKESYDIRQAVWPIYEGGMLDLIASDISLANSDSWLMALANREFTFKKFLETNLDFFSQYDVILIDSAPSTNLLTNTFMCACDKILAVVWLDGQSLKAMQVLAANVDELNSAFEGMGFHLDVHIVANGYHPSYGSCKEALTTLVQSYPGVLNNVIIPHSTSFMRQIELFKEEDSGTVLEREPNSIAARSIIDLARSLIKEYHLKLADHELL